jgi:cell division protein ZapA (FtsZ GTPase activity inhibitor)
VSDTISVKIQIAGRAYPLKVTAEQQTVIEKAASIVNERLKEYEKAYGVRDIQDLLAMCALHLSAEQLGFQKNQTLEEDKINKELQALADLVKAFDKD